MPSDINESNVLTVEDIIRARELMSQYVDLGPRTFLYNNTVSVGTSQLVRREEGKTVGTEMLF